MNNKVLVIGSGPIIIGQACEFDYSGVQACKVLMRNGFKVILLNNNPASVMTDYNLSYVTYLESIEFSTVLNILKKDKPSYILCNVGGQTALNILIKCYRKGILFKKNISVLGTSVQSVINSENRSIFRNLMTANHIPIAHSYKVESLKEAIFIRSKLVSINVRAFVIRTSFSLGGSGGSVVKNYTSFLIICNKVFNFKKNSSLLIEESLYGYKEYELELLIDRFSNFIVVCSMENFDPIGIHTGDSIVISPIQTLTNTEYQKLRNLAFDVIVSLKITKGGVNIQFAVNPFNGIIKVIEVNPRISRSSALASKITGYPIAKISTELSIGYGLFDLKNDMIPLLPSSFEPSIDYIIVKIPKFSVEKFGLNNVILGIQMFSIGEVMGIGECITFSYQYALRSVYSNMLGFVNLGYERINILKKLSIPNPKRLNFIYEYFKYFTNFEKLVSLMNIDPWFLQTVKRIVINENYVKNLRKLKLALNLNFLILLKKNGFSDLKISDLLHANFLGLLNFRIKHGIFPSYKKIDACSSEFDTNVSYMYSSYGNFCESSNYDNSNKVVLLGSGPNKVGQGIEFDYCCVHSSLYLKKKGFNSIIINNNPETVSTDYDISSKLFFLPVDFEEVLNIFHSEKPIGFITQCCGQLDYLLVNLLKKYHIPVFGTSLNNIIISEDRNRFSSLIRSIKLNYPKGFLVYNYFDLFNGILKFGFPVIIRPSYILGGKDIRIIKNYSEMLSYFYYIKRVNVRFPLYVDRFLNGFNEVDIDCLSDGNNILILPIVHHIENVGIHSGDSTAFIPSLFKKKILNKIKKIVVLICIKLKVVGFANVQIALNNSIFYVLEVNLRASRSIPFVIKGINFNSINLASRCLLFGKFSKILLGSEVNFFLIKEPVFSFIKYRYSDPILGPEMKSTGEISCFGKKIFSGILKSQVSLNFRLLDIRNILFSFVKFNNAIVNLVFKFAIAGYKVYFFSDFVCLGMLCFSKLFIDLRNDFICLEFSNSFSSNYFNLRLYCKNNDVFIISTIEFSRYFINSILSIENLVILSLNDVYFKKF